MEDLTSHPGFAAEEEKERKMLDLIRRMREGLRGFAHTVGDWDNADAIIEEADALLKKMEK